MADQQYALGLLRRADSWQTLMGGWDAPIWRDIQAYLDETEHADRDQEFGREFRAAWPALVDPDDEADVNGGDLVDWCSRWWTEYTLKKPQNAASGGIVSAAKAGEKSDMPLEASQIAAGAQPGVPGTPGSKTEDSATPAQAEPPLRRFYVTMTWDDWPEGGSYGTVVLAEDQDQAEHECRLQMAASRAEGFPESDDESTTEYWLRAYGDEWVTVDCWDLDEFIERHARPGPFDAKHPVTPGSISALDLIRGEGGAS